MFFILFIVVLVVTVQYVSSFSIPKVSPLFGLKFASKAKLILVTSVLGGLVITAPSYFNCGAMAVSGGGKGSLFDFWCSVYW